MDTNERAASSRKGWRAIAEDLKLVGEALQPVAVIAGIIVGVVTYKHTVSEEAEARSRADDQRQRDLSHAYYEKQLDLYLEATRIAARLATAKKDDPEHEKLVNRFWELYWGELAFVESRVGEQAPTKPADRPIESLMVQICKAYIVTDGTADEKCHGGNDPALKAALDLSHQASDEVRWQWLRYQPKE